MSEVTKDTKEDAVEDNTTHVVFDAGWGNHLSLSGLHFQNGLFLTRLHKEKELIRNFIKQTGENWTEATFDPENPRHQMVATLPSNEHIITGIHTADKYLRPTGENQLANSIIDGTFTKLATENPGAIDPATIVAAQAAVAASNAPVAKAPLIAPTTSKK